MVSHSMLHHTSWYSIFMDMTATHGEYMLMVGCHSHLSWANAHQ